MANVTTLLAVGSEQLIQWIALGVCGVIVLIAFIAGLVKGFSNFGRRPISWAFGCAAFLVLETLFHENNFLLNLIGLKLEPAAYSFVSTLVWLVAALLARWILFGVLGLIIKGSKSRKTKKAGKVARAEKVGGEEYLPDENKPYTPLPVDGYIKPGPLNRLFGGVFAALNTAVILALLLSVAMVIVSVTPLRGMVEWLYGGSFEVIWNYVRTYALDFVLIALIVMIVVKGYKVGIVYGVRSVGVFFAYIAAVVGSFYLPFSPFVAEGAALGFMTTIGVKLANLLPAVIPMGIKAIVLKIVAGIVLAIVLCLLIKLIAWLLDKLLELVDNVAVLTVIDGVIGAIVFMAIAAAVVVVLVGVLYVLEYYNVFMGSQLFTSKSPLLGGLYDMFDEFLRPMLEKLAMQLA